MVTAIDVANFFIDLENNVGSIHLLNNAEPMTNLRLNKMLYFAQVHSIARFGEPLFSEDIEAWEYGPVIEDVYRKFNSYGRNPITAVSEGYSPYEVFSDKQIALLLDVEREYRRYSTWGLVEITHKEGPWKKAWNNPDHVISMKDLEEYASQITPLHKFEVPYTPENAIGFHDEEGHLVLPKDEDDDDYDSDYDDALNE